MPVTPADIAALPKPGFLIGDKKVTEGQGLVHEHRYAATGELTYKAPLGSADEDIRTGRGRLGRIAEDYGP